MNLNSDQKVGCEHYRRKLKFIVSLHSKIKSEIKLNFFLDTLLWPSLCL